MHIANHACRHGHGLRRRVATDAGERRLHVAVPVLPSCVGAGVLDARPMEGAERSPPSHLGPCVRAAIVGSPSHHGDEVLGASAASVGRACRTGSATGPVRRWRGITYDAVDVSWTHRRYIVRALVHGCLCVCMWRLTQAPLRQKTSNSFTIAKSRPPRTGLGLLKPTRRNPTAAKVAKMRRPRSVLMSPVPPLPPMLGMRTLAPRLLTSRRLMVRRDPAVIVRSAFAQCWSAVQLVFDLEEACFYLQLQLPPQCTHYTTPTGLVCSTAPRRWLLLDRKALDTSAAMPSRGTRSAASPLSPSLRSADPDLRAVEPADDDDVGGRMRLPRLFLPPTSEGRHIHVNGPRHKTYTSAHCGSV